MCVCASLCCSNMKAVLYCNSRAYFNNRVSQSTECETIQNIPFYIVESAPELLSESFTFAIAPDGDDGIFLVNYYIFVYVSMNELRFCNLLD